jgi:high-affinity Fe2+/Pb2+ permease
MTDKRDLPHRPGLGLAIVVGSVIAMAIGAFLTYGNYRTTGDSSIFSAGGVLIALGAAAFWAGIKMRRAE